LLIGGISILGGLAFSYQLGTDLLNYGALLAFMGVNIASVVLGWRTGRLTQWLPMLISSAGFLTCLFIWTNLGPVARIAGTAWALIGIVLWIVRRKQIHLPDATA
jgi:hypothetical protein